MNTLKAEFMLLNWHESASGGSKLIFAVSPDEMEQFKTLDRKDGKKLGQRLMAVLVPIGDDEQPVPHETKKPSTSKFPSGRTGLAVRWGADPDFRAWLRDSFETPICDEVAAALMIRTVCEVESRKLLDLPGVAERFDRLIRIPYSDDRKERGLD